LHYTLITLATSGRTSPYEPKIKKAKKKNTSKINVLIKGSSHRTAPEPKKLYENSPGEIVGNSGELGGDQTSNENCTKNLKQKSVNEEKTL